MTGASDRRTETCLRHGAYESVRKGSKLAFWSKCPTCLQDHEREVQALLVQEEADRRTAAILARLAAIGVPVRFHGATLDGYDAPDEPRRKVKDWATGYVASFPEHRKAGKSAILIGRPGTGKTHIACAIARGVADLGFSARYTTVSGAIRRIKDSWRKESEESEGAVINDYGGCDLLVLDEVGIQNGSQFEGNILFDLLNRRYEHMLPTVLVSNLPIAEVTSLLGERVIDRLREGGGQMMAFGWESHRRKA